MKELSIEIPLGAKDSELKSWEYTIPEGMEAEIKDGKIIVREKESEDERIRRCIKDLIKENTFSNIYGVTKEQCLAWIEKQDNFSNKEVGNYDHKNVLETLMNEQTLNKLEELGKDITKDKETATKFLKSAGIIDENGELAEPYRTCEYKSKWSEEDKKLIDDTCHLINMLASGYGKKVTEPLSFAGVQQINSIKTRLRALIDSSSQSHWKPNEEQIETLENVRKILHTNKEIYSKANHLMFNFEEFIRTLKKLRGE